MRSMTWKKWEAALAIGLCVAICAAFIADSEQKAFTGQFLRLHVVAHSDTAEDQALKLRVRDRILAAASPLVQDAADANQASAILAEHLPVVLDAAQKEIAASGLDFSVRAELGPERFPTRHYGDFALPAGEYEALRVIIGDGAGQNWWCVVFPPLCVEAVSGTADTTVSLSPDHQRLISGDGGDAVLKFKCLELWSALTGR